MHYCFAIICYLSRNTVISEIFAIILFSRIALKDIFATRIIRNLRHDLPISVNERGALRIELKLLLKFLRNRCTRTFTPERLKLELLVGWQVNKNDSPVCSTLILHRKQKRMLCAALYNNQLRISWTKNYAQLGLFYKNI